MSDSAEKLRTVEFAPIGIWKLDSALNVVEANNAVSKQIGMPRTELLGKHIATLLPSLPLNIFQAVQQSGQPITQKPVCLTLGNTQQLSYWEITIGPVQDGKRTTGFVLSTVEVTERERLLQQREDFVSALSHNLKTPLIGADRILELLLNGTLGDLNQQQNEMLATLRVSNSQLLDMVRDLIDVYRYETNTVNLKFERFDLGETARACAEEARKRIRTRLSDVRISFTSPCFIVADRSAMQRLFANLLENAVLNTPPAGLVQVQGECQENTARIVVSDNGVGLGTNDPDKLFMRFWQGEPGRSYRPWTGLGLYLCRQIVLAHGGQILVDSENDQGTIFTITLPLSPSTNR